MRRRVVKGRTLFSNANGFSLVSVMVAAGILGGLSLVIMQLSENMSNSKSSAMSAADELALRSEIRMILDHERFCRVSLAGDGPAGEPDNPVTFKKEDIDEPNEGLDVELWLSNQLGDMRTQKKLSASDSDFNKYGKLKIKSIKLIMDNQTGINYEESGGHSDIGKLIVTAEKNLSDNQKREVPLAFPIIVGMRTDSGGESTILSCSREKNHKPKEQAYDLRYCVSLGKDGAGYGTALCWEKDGSNVAAMKTADRHNGISPSRFKTRSHNIGMVVAGCISLGRDAPGFGTGLCWEKDGNHVVAIKTANGNNSDNGIGSGGFKHQKHDTGIPLAGCINLGYDGMGYGTALCKEKDGKNVAAIKTANGNNSDHGIGSGGFKSVRHYIGI